MDKSNVPIVVVAYNRPKSLSRLLTSLKRAKYPKNNICLIISIDKAKDNDLVLKIADEFSWSFGNKIVVYQEKNLGLRSHILKCGDLSQTYGAVIVLEDDLYVSPNFYLYTLQALELSENDKNIAGISLYNHQLNVHTRDNFLAMEDGYDNWYFQFASSWGQAWSREQWSGFKKWYCTNPDLNNNLNIPAYVRSWSEKSWLKYNIAYLIEKNRYFLYPKLSLTTNFSDAGTHVGKDSTIYQVPLDYGSRKEYIFSRLNDSRSVYNAFYENAAIAKKLKINSADLTVDLHGYSNRSQKKYIITSKIWDYKIITSFGKSLKPQDANIFEEIPGDEIFLYNTEIIEKNPHKSDFKRKLLYNIKYLSLKDALSFVKNEGIAKLIRGTKKIIKKC